MTPEPGSTGPARSGFRRALPLLLGLAAVAVAVVLAISLSGSDPDDVEASGDPGSPVSGSTSPAPSGTSSPAVSPSAKPSGKASDPSGSPAATPSEPPLETVTPGPKVKPVRVPLDAKAELGNGVQVEVTRIESVKGEARGAGEVGGPAVRLTVSVQNDRASRISLNRAIVTLFYGPDETPAGDLSGPGVQPFPSSLAAGASASGRFVFRVPPDERGRLRADFTYTAEAPRVIFRGSAR